MDASGLTRGSFQVNPFVEHQGETKATWELYLGWFLHVIAPPSGLTFNAT